MLWLSASEDTLLPAQTAKLFKIEEEISFISGKTARRAEIEEVSSFIFL